MEREIGKLQRNFVGLQVRELEFKVNQFKGEVHFYEAGLRHQFVVLIKNQHSKLQTGQPHIQGPRTVEVKPSHEGHCFSQGLRDNQLKREIQNNLNEGKEVVKGKRSAED